MEIFNEIVLMLVMYTIICFSPLVSSPHVKFSIGYMTMFIVSLHLFVNFSIIGKATVRTAKLKIFLKMSKRKHYKQREKMRIRLKRSHAIRRERLR